MSDIIDINVNPTVEEVTIDVQPNVTVVNVSTIQGIPEAPIDGEIYGRQDASWEIIPPVDVSALVPYTGATTDVDLGENGLSTGFVKFDTTPTDIPEEQGVMFWDEDDNTVDVILNGYRMKIGEDTFYPVKNQSGSTILKGTNVKFAGTVGSSGRLLILPFLANGTDPSYVYMGVTAEDIADGEDGKVLWFGRLRGLNTNAFNEGDVLYASTTSAGGFQTAIPTGTDNVVQVSAVIKKSVNQGVIFIRPQIEPFAKIPTLQEVTEGENKNLINGNNFQGTQAGESTSPILVTHSNMFGEQAGRTSTGAYVNLFGEEAGISQEGGHVNALGQGSAGTNTGSHVNAFGQASLYGNTGRHANAFGEEGGNFNNFKNVNLFGFQAEADQDNQTVFSKWVSGVTKFLARLSYNNITANRSYNLLDESGDLPITTSKNANFTAVNSVFYTAIATLTVTDPTPVEGQGYIVFVRNGTTTIDGVGYTSGNLIYRFYQGGAWSSTVFGVSAPINTATQTALDARERMVAFDKTANTVTGTTAETIIGSVLVPANGFTADMDLIWDVPLGKNNATALDFKFYVNTENNLTGATQIALLTLSNQRNTNFIRRMLISGGNLDMLSSSSLSGISNYGVLLTGTPTVVPYDITVPHYFIVTTTNSDTAVQAVYKTMKITGWKL
jgi:hypothetical protein